MYNFFYGFLMDNLYIIKTNDGMIRVNCNVSECKNWYK